MEISHEIRDQLARRCRTASAAPQLTVGLRPGAVRREVDREPDHRGPARPGHGGAGHPGLPALGALDAGHRGLHPAVGAGRADRAVGRRLLAQPAHPRRAHHRDRPGGRRLDRRAGEHQATPGVRRGEAARDPHRASARWPARSPRRRSPRSRCSRRSPWSAAWSASCSRPFAITVTVALLASLLVSLTVIPVLAYWFLQAAGGTARRRGGPAGGRGEGAAQPAAAGLPAGDRLRHPHAVDRWSPSARRAGARRHLRPGAAAGDQLPRRLRPEHAQHHARTLPAGTSLAATDAAAKQVEAVLAAHRRRRDVPGHRRAAADSLGFGGGGTNTATYSVTLARGRRRAADAGDAARASSTSSAPAPASSASAAGGGGGSASQLEVIVQAADAGRR